MSDETRMTTERFFGGVGQRLENLHVTLQYVSEHDPTEDDLKEWILENTTAGEGSTVRRNIAFLDSIDLLEVIEDNVECTNKGEIYWSRQEPLVMYAGLEKGVDGFREIVRSIAAGKRSLEAIQHNLQEAFPDYELPEGVVTGHLDWLKSLDLVTEENNKYWIDIEGGEFEVGEQYNRWFLHDVLKGERYKGIATPSELPLVLLFTGDSGSVYGYEDVFLDDDSFLYTGEGTEGDMTMDDGNEAIRDHKENGEALHLFEDTDMPWMVTYLGEYEYISHKTDTLPDENGKDRDAFRFRLAPVGGTKIEGETPSSLSDEELYEKAKQSTPSSSSGASSGGSGSGRSYPRSQYVREYALRMANGVCQGCGVDAPFIAKNGDPYLEVHHLTRRSDGGADSPENVIALCPNCHRRVHEGRDGADFNQSLKQ
ncbi:HNH endonuclease [Halostella sp. JP-L12]|uniref:HNH endonuclease n=1 Tax=Halostella TaxID=1843185 RepID=UPI000EF82F0E|nr:MULTISPECIES: HNH endonuclease [Halostella]NHN49316.1 HNH endonuclease [Halostella sp. JP-L12]